MPGVEPDPPRCKEALSQVSFIPKVMRTGGLEPPQPEALALQADELADAQRPLEGWPAGLEPASPGSRPGVFASIPRPQRGRPGSNRRPLA